MEKEILGAAKDAIGKAILSELVGFNKPLNKLTERVIGANKDALYSLINNEFSELIASAHFRDALKEALNAKLAKTLVSRMGGELEKQVNSLQQNPQTRAKITLAIDKIISEL